MEPVASHVVLPCYGIVLECQYGTGTIKSDLHDANGAWVDYRETSKEYDAAVNALESLILAHYMAGVNVRSLAYVEGIKTAMDAITNNYGD